jgi:dihydrofolate reductase
VKFRLYIAVSIDGFIATPDGGVAWLDDYPAEDFGFDEFLGQVETVVMGRTTYDQVFGLGDWPFADKRVIVLSSRPFRGAPEGVERREDDVRRIAESLRGGGDVWVMGGAKAAQSFLAAGLIDEMELYVIPVLLGDGIALFARPGPAAQLSVASVQEFPRGVVRLVYRERLPDGLNP